MANIHSDVPFQKGNKCMSCDYIKQFDAEEAETYSQDTINEIRTKCANCRTEFKGDINIKLYGKKALLAEPRTLPSGKGRQWNMDKTALKFMLVLRDKGKSYKEIAELTDKSLVTVFHTLTLSYPNPETNERVRQAIEELGFVATPSQKYKTKKKDSESDIAS